MRTVLKFPMALGNVGLISHVWEDALSCDAFWQQNPFLHMAQGYICILSACILLSPTSSAAVSLMDEVLICWYLY